MKPFLGLSILLLTITGQLRAAPTSASDTRLEGRFQTATFTMW